MTTATAPEMDQKARNLGLKWFGSKLAARLVREGTMAKNVALLRRGSKKMQDGTLGKDTGEPEEPDDMNIRVGDETTHNHYAAPEAVDPPAKPETPAKPPNDAAMILGKMALASALTFVGGAGIAGPAIAWMLGAFDKTDPAPVTSPIDTDTRNDLILS